MRRAGFTLTELLIVIGIIMLLMGLLLPAIVIIRNHAMRTKAITLIRQVDAACNQYRLLNGAYPDTPLARTTTPTMKDVFMSGTSFNDAPTVSEQNWGEVAEMLRLALQSTDREAFMKATAMNDPWGKPLHYRPVQYYPYKQGTNVTPKIDGDPPPRPDSYQLWSNGYNEQDEYGEDGSDDITDWR